MQFAKVSNVSRENQFSVIDIYSFENYNIQGLFSNGLYGNDKVFLNLISLILMIEDCMNSISFPQPMSQYRKMEHFSAYSFKRESFRDKAEFQIPDEDIPAEWKDREPVASFKLRIAFRTISGWQGEAEDVRSGERIKFKSDLEFIYFLINVLNRYDEKSK